MRLVVRGFLQARRVAAQGWSAPWPEGVRRCYDALIDRPATRAHLIESLGP